MSKKLNASSLVREMIFDSGAVFGSSTDFEMNFFEQVLDRDEKNTEVMENLAHLYTDKGLYEKGLALDIRLSILEPTNPMVFYNLGCSYALVAQIEESFDALDQALALGWCDWEHLLGDSDLVALKDNPRLAPMIKRMKALEPMP